MKAQVFGVEVEADVEADDAPPDGLAGFADSLFAGAEELLPPSELAELEEEALASPPPLFLFDDDE